MPGQLKPLLALMDGRGGHRHRRRARRSGALPPADAARALARQAAAARRAHGPRAVFPGADGGYVPAAGAARGAPPRLAGARGIVRVEPPARRRSSTAPPTAWPVWRLRGDSAARPLEYAADRTPSELRPAARQGAELVVTTPTGAGCSCRPGCARTRGPRWRRRPDQRGRRCARSVPRPRHRGATVATSSRAPATCAPRRPGSPSSPSRRPSAALDGSPRSEWLGDTHLEADRRWVEVGFRRARDVPTWTCSGGRARARPSRPSRSPAAGIPCGRAGTGSGSACATRARCGCCCAATPTPRTCAGNGLAEVRIPGVRIRESLRPPTLLQSALRGGDLGRSSLSYVFTRTTGDRPYRREAGRRPVRTASPVTSRTPMRAARGTRGRRAGPGRASIHPARVRTARCMDVGLARRPGLEIDRLAGSAAPTCSAPPGASRAWPATGRPAPSTATRDRVGGRPAGRGRAVPDLAHALAAALTRLRLTRSALPAGAPRGCGCAWTAPRARSARRRRRRRGPPARAHGSALPARLRGRTRPRGDRGDRRPRWRSRGSGDRGPWLRASADPRPDRLPRRHGPYGRRRDGPARVRHRGGPGRRPPLRARGLRRGAALPPGPSS